MRFQYLEPKNIKEAVSLLNKYDSQARVIAGGTDLMVKMKNKVLKPDYVIELEHISRLDYLKFTRKIGLLIGALTKISSLEYSPLVKENYTILANAAGLLGSMAVRNLATLGGNICNAAPSAETAPALICLGAQARMVGPEGERIVPVEAFFTGPGKTVLGKGEILIEIQVPPPIPGAKSIYFKHSPRGAMDLAVVGIAVVASFTGEVITDIKIALGAVAPTPIRALKAEEVVKGKPLTEAMIKECAITAAAETCCISDVRASAGYRQEMVRVFTRRALETIVQEGKR
jgi:aerobic carbon-monoxide dehydrogenase medium subunit